jgi:hypothetical protein
MNLRNRTLLRTGAAAAGLVAAVAFAGPAFAGGTDVAVDLTGTTIAADASGKFGSITVKNLGSTTPEEIEVIFDISAVEESLIEVQTCEGGFEEDGKVYCVVPTDVIPAPGGAVDLVVPLARKVDGSGPAGKLGIEVFAAGEDKSTLGDNSKTVDLTLGEHSGVDLRVTAEDVRNSLDSEGNLTDELVKPGGTAVVFGFFVNEGDMTANGVRVTVTLPEQATFAEEEEGCTYTADNRTVTCDYADVVLIPADKDETEEGKLSGGGAFFPLTVAADAAEGAVLPDGIFHVEAIETVEYVDPTLKRGATNETPELPDNVEMGGGDVDSTDNTDEFSVFVAEDTSGGGGGLPVTGPAATVIGGAGAAILVLGTVLFVSARRRRIVTRA